MPSNRFLHLGYGIRLETKEKLLELLSHVAFQTEQLRDFTRNSVINHKDIQDLEVQVDELHRVYDELLAGQRTPRAAFWRPFQWYRPVDAGKTWREPWVNGRPAYESRETQDVPSTES